jgi:trimethylamine corrinoid protein
VTLMVVSNSLIISAFSRLQEEKVLGLVKQSLAAGQDPFMILEEVRTGLEVVGDIYNQGKYFLADLIMAAEIFMEVQKLVLGDRKHEETGPPQVIFGTVETDIHDIGKNITISTMRYYGLNVLDLGVNVPPRVFLKEVQETGAPILCLSGLISQSYDAMKNTVRLLDRASQRPATRVIIGGLVTEVVRDYTGADYWVKDCRAGVALCREILAASSRSSQMTGS